MTREINRRGQRMGRRPDVLRQGETSRMSRSATGRSVPVVVLAVAQAVEAQDGEGDGQAGEDGGPRGETGKALGFLEHSPPAGVGRLGAEAQITQGCFSQDGGGEADAGLDQEGGQAVGKDVAEDDAGVAVPMARAARTYCAPGC